MDWVLRSPQIHSTFSQLGYVQADGYHVNENCNSALETILHNILEEDKYLRTYRRSISFGQNIQKDIIPLLIHAKDGKTVELIIKILVNLTIPIECLLNVNLIATTDFGRHTIFEINNLLAATKVAFTDVRASKSLVEFLRKNVDVEKTKLSENQRTNASNCLLLLRNILHIPETNGHLNPSKIGSAHSIQNQILWNIFSQSVDKLIFKSMIICEAKYWGVTLVQLVALLYKDQPVVTLQKLLYNWLEASPPESSGDNESNTSPPDRGSVDSSPMLTSSSDLTSDSSDNDGGGCDKAGGSSMNTTWEHEPGTSPTLHHNSQAFQPSEQDNTDYDKSATMQHNEQDTADDKSSRFGTTNEDQTKSESETTPCMAAPRDRGDQNTNQKQVVFETSDCGYGTQIENQESVSTSSNDDKLPTNKPVHQKPRNAKQRPNNKPRYCSTNQERKRKKIVKRGKANIILHVRSLSHKTPTDDDISNVLKKFTVDFLLKGFNSLVRTLHNEILTNRELQIDVSHFFWLITYFLKFATQIELDFELIDSVLSFEIVSYLTAEGVNLCEQFELVVVKLEGCDLTPYLRRQHLVVIAIKEFVQAIEVYKKMPHLDEADHEKLKNLEIKMCETGDLRSMLVLLLRHYNPKYHTKQYLQDLIITNHILLVFLDNVMKIPDYHCSLKMTDHIRQFATPQVMAMYGLLLENYVVNERFVNDCIFTLMHHVGGEESIITLFQPNILKTFAAIWKSKFEICDDWSDLVEYVINIFLMKPDILNSANLFLEQDNFKVARSFDVISTHSEDLRDGKSTAMKSNATETITALERWTEDEISSLNWSYLQCSAQPDVIGTITKQLKEESIKKTRESVIKELFRQNLISREFYESQLKGESDRNKRTEPLNKGSPDEEIRKFCEQLIRDGKLTCLEWVQKVLLEICYIKLQLQRRELKKSEHLESESKHLESESKLLHFEIFRLKHDDFPVVSPVAYHSLIVCESVPLVPWNCQQARICKDLVFQQLLSKLGFLMPADTGQLFIRIPYFWTVDCLFDVAGKIRSIDTSKLKFSVSELSGSGKYKAKPENTIPTSDMIKVVPLVGATDYFHIHNPKIARMNNFIPRPGPSFKSESGIEQLNWLQIVQKSQQSKITLKSITKTTEDIVMQSPGADRVNGMLPDPFTMLSGPSAMLPGPTAMLPGPSGMLPSPSAMLPSPSAMLPGPSAMLPGPSGMLPSPSAMLPGPSAMLSGPSAMLPIPPAMLPGPSAMLPSPSAMLSGSSLMLSGPSAMLSGPSAMFLGPSAIMSGPSAMLSGPSAMLHGPAAMLSGPAAMLAGPSAMLPGPAAMLPGPSAMLAASPSRSPVVRHASRHVRHDAWHVHHDQLDRHAARSHQAGAPHLHRTMRADAYY